jgi:hypothetical protein
MITKFNPVDSLIDGEGRRAGAAKISGSGNKQVLMIRCPSCARIAKWPIFPNTNDQGCSWVAEIGRAGMNLEPAMVFPCCGWTGGVHEGGFLELEVAGQ